MESIYHPENITFEARIFALRGVLKARSEVYESTIYADDSAWSETLGSRAEIEDAKQVIDGSLAIAATDFQKDEFQRALDEGLITDGELRDVLDAAHRHEMAKSRSDDHTDQSNQSDKQS